MGDETRNSAAPAAHPNERQRLAEVQLLDFFDAELQARLDRLTRLTASLCKTSTVLLTLVEETQVLFKSRQGMAQESCPRSQAFCAHAILEAEDIFVVPDATLDPRFAQHPLVRCEGGIRFYMAAVLHSRTSDLPLGTLCMLDTAPRVPTPELVTQLQMMGAMAADELYRAGQLRSRRSELAAHHRVDELTGLPTIQDFLERLDAAIQRDERSAVAVVDLDQFAALNRVLGRQLGDILLAQAAGRLVAAAPEGAVVARGQSDEVLIMISCGQRGCEALALKTLLETFRHSFEVDGTRHHMSATIGAAASRGRDDRAADVLERGRQARREARYQRLGTFIFDSPREKALAERFVMGNELHRALEEGAGQLRMVYQPKVRLGDGKLTGAEALMRWESPTLGRVSPGLFVPVAEDIGLSHALGWFALRQVCETLQRWRLQGLSPPPVAVNLSAEDFDTPDFVGRTLRLLDSYGLPPQLLELEITERVLVRDPASSARTIKALSEVGIKVGIDDFGTGYSSLSWLANLPVSALKIDRAFVNQVGEHQSRIALLGAIVDLAANLNLESVAEGVETESELAFIRARGCDTAQGWLFSYPLEKTAFEALLASGEDWIQLVRPGFRRMVA